MASYSGVIDSGTNYQIVPSTRQIVVPQAYKVIGTVGEHNAEQLTFKCPKLIDGHDISQCVRKYITWKNVNEEIGHDELKNMTEDDENLYFTWDISNGLTVAKGLVSFSVHFEDINTSGRTLYRWSTAPCTECEILDSINAVLNTYEAVYVADDTLVFADYNAVQDETLPLDTDGFIPEGTIEIRENGIHDVGRHAVANVAVNPPTGSITITQNGTVDVKDYAEAHVAIPMETPQIDVSSDGTITATANSIKGQTRIGVRHDPDFIAANIKKGVNIFGVEGTYDIVPTGTQKITENGLYNVGGMDSVEVAIPFDVPAISIDPDSGDIVATANGKEGVVPGSSLSTFDKDFVARNIRKGTKIFGVEGTYKYDIPLVSGEIVYNGEDSTLADIIAFYSGYDVASETEDINFFDYTRLEADKPLSLQLVEQAMVIIEVRKSSSYYASPFRLGTCKNVSIQYDGGNAREVFVLRPYSDDFIIQIIKN